MSRMHATFIAALLVSLVSPMAQAGHVVLGGGAYAVTMEGPSDWSLSASEEHFIFKWFDLVDYNFGNGVLAPEGANAVKSTTDAGITFGICPDTGDWAVGDGEATAKIYGDIDYSKSPYLDSSVELKNVAYREFGSQSDFSVYASTKANSRYAVRVKVKPSGLVPADSHALLKGVLRLKASPNGADQTLKTGVAYASIGGSTVTASFTGGEWRIRGRINIEDPNTHELTFQNVNTTTSGKTLSYTADISELVEIAGDGIVIKSNAIGELDSDAVGSDPRDPHEFGWSISGIANFVLKKIEVDDTAQP